MTIDSDYDREHSVPVMLTRSEIVHLQLAWRDCGEGADCPNVEGKLARAVHVKNPAELQAAAGTLPR